MIEEAPLSTDEAYERAIRLRKAKQTNEALAVFKDLLAGRYGRLDRKRRRHGWVMALGCATRMKDWTGAEALALEALKAFPGLPAGYQHLGEALLQQGRHAEAAEALERAVELDPDLIDARMLLKLAREGRRSAPAPTHAVRTWPSRQSAFDNPQRAIEQYILKGWPRDRFIRPDSVFTTMGSCFAENLARRLIAAGYRANFEPIGEEINSTYANRYLLDWIENGVIDAPTALMQEAYGPAVRERYRGAFAATDVFVMSLGVAPAFFDRRTGDFAFMGVKSATSREHLQRDNIMRTTTVAENVANMRHILASVRRLCTNPPKVVLTVSPVSLAGTTEMESAVTADCLSKSTLRLVCQEIWDEQRDRGVSYWPSFEIVRWFGPHYGHAQPLVFGGDDGDTRHVSTWLVDMIIDLFLQHHAAPPSPIRPAASASAAS